MSQRGKRPNRLENDETAPPTKRRKGRPSKNLAIDDSGAKANTSSSQVPGKTTSLWQARSIADLKMSSIYNRSAPEAPAELFR